LKKSVSQNSPGTLFGGIKKFFAERERRKLVSELKNRRHSEDDILTPALRRDFDFIIEELEKSDDAGDAVAAARKKFSALPFPVKRGNIFAFLDLILVVGAVAFGLRALFFQPFRIPTSSMQPTLYGIHYIEKESFDKDIAAKFPAPVSSLLSASTRAFAVADRDSTYYDGTGDIQTGMVFDKTSFRLGDQLITLPGNPDQVASYAKLYNNKVFKKGDTIADGVVSLGDHLFVERFSLYLKPPQRGDVMVFSTEGLFVDGIPLSKNSGFYYIKRIAALPGDTVKIVNDQLYVRPRGEKEFRKIQDIADKFKKIYSGRGGYHGHLSNMGRESFAYGTEYVIPYDRYLMLGDNSQFSMDSRYFGTVHRNSFIGRAWLVFFPFSRRMGIADAAEPLDIPTGERFGTTFPVMYKQ